MQSPSQGDLAQASLPGEQRAWYVLAQGILPALPRCPCICTGGCLLEHEYNDGMEQILPSGHASAQLPTGLTHSIRPQENHSYPARAVLARLPERRAIQLCRTSAPPSKFQIWLVQRQICTRRVLAGDRLLMPAGVVQTVCSPVMSGLSCTDFCSGVVYLLLCGLPAHCPQSGDTAAAKVLVTAAESETLSQENRGNPK